MQEDSRAPHGRQTRLHGTVRLVAQHCATEAAEVGPDLVHAPCDRPDQEQLECLRAADDRLVRRQDLVAGVGHPPAGGDRGLADARAELFYEQGLVHLAHRAGWPEGGTGAEADVVLGHQLPGELRDQQLGRGGMHRAHGHHEHARGRPVQPRHGRQLALPARGSQLLLELLDELLRRDARWLRHGDDTGAFPQDLHGLRLRGRDASAARQKGRLRQHFRHQRGLLQSGLGTGQAHGVPQLQRPLPEAGHRGSRHCSAVVEAAGLGGALPHVLQHPQRRLPLSARCTGAEDRVVRDGIRRQAFMPHPRKEVERVHPCPQVFACLDGNTVRDDVQLVALQCYTFH
mmetsp:Transcript_1183/g.3952  ORF Transcript_1183/g.3952 Transcript_1183/m.3952 type:complete len:344 (-) Transcript_1183:494-1525(-)